MSIDLLPDQFEQFVSRARTALNLEITGAKSVIDAAHAEKSAAQNAVTNLQAELKSAQDQLTTTMSDLGRATTLAGINTEISGARKTLETIKAEIAGERKALEKLSKDRSEREAQIVALGNEAQRLIAIRTEGETVMANIKRQLNSVQIGARP